jgi:murein DD-endopeptidase
MANHRRMRGQRDWDDVELDVEGDESDDMDRPARAARSRASAMPTWALATIGVSVAANLAFGLHALSSRSPVVGANGKLDGAEVPAMLATGPQAEEAPVAAPIGEGSGSGAAAELDPVAAIDPVAAPVGEGSGSGAQADPGTGVAPVALLDVPAAPEVNGALQTLTAAVEGSIPATISPLAGTKGDALSAAFTRLIMWDVDLRRDLRRGDQLAVVWEPTNDNAQVLISAARFNSGKLAKTLTAYRFRATGDALPRYWSADGKEVEYRLNNSPIESYDQVTSLLKDRPTHHGMDFKAPVGTEIKSPWAGRVTRTNWNWSANGNCIEVEYANGLVAKYLHLNENKVKPGDRVSAGQVIALSGNTGRSTGPHLHYQLERGTSIIDPVKEHGTHRRELPAADRAAFDAEVARLNTLLGN